MAQESGKPMKFARGEVSRAVETFTFAADAARSMHGETIPMDAAKGGLGKIGYYVRVPVGVIAAITPCTNPTETLLNNGIGMIAGGNAVVFNAHPLAARTSIT